MTAGPALRTAPPRVLLGVALVSLAALVLELTLTRLFSATMFYHFAFLAISLALFGAGASGVFVYVLRERFAGREERALPLASALFAVATVGALLVILANPLSPVSPGLRTLGPLAVIYGAAALPFFFAGLALSLAVTAYAAGMSRLYFCDLGGAALGCLLLIPALDGLGAVDTVLAVAVAAALAALVLAGGDAGRGLRAPLLVLVALGAGLLAWNRAAGRIDIREAKGLPEEGVLFSRWNSFSRVTVVETADPDRQLIFIDSDAATVLHRDGSDLRKHEAQRDRVESLAYHLGGRRRVLIIGPGGGVDVIIARLFGARDITAVEVNPLVARDVMSSEPFQGYSGALYEQPGVRLVVDEARSFIRRSREGYDLILGTMVDTWAATAAGAFALTENNLYTVEAFRDYAARLGPEGILSLTRWYQEPPDQILRLVSLARALMAEQGTGDPARHLLLVRGRPEDGQPLPAATFLFKKSPFTDAEVERAEAFAERLGFDVIYSPRTRPPGDVTRLAEAADPSAVWRSLESDVSPSRDDRPFFFQSMRLSRLLHPRWARGEWRRTNLGTTVLFGLVAITGLMVLAFLLGPLFLVRRRLREAAGEGRLPFLLYFACLGAGFIVIEVALVQKCVLFLGHPVYALSVVLFSLLVASGLGSLLSGRIVLLREALGRVLPAISTFVVVYVLVLPAVFYGLVHLGAAWRIGITVALLAPLGLVMGVPMPAGIRLLADRANALVPWAWGLNGAASVTGSVGAVALAMVAGFNATLLVGAGFYLLALACLARAVPRRVPTGS